MSLPDDKPKIPEDEVIVVDQEPVEFAWFSSMSAACRAAKQMYEGMDGDNSGLDPDDDKITAERLLSVGFKQTGQLGLVYSWQYGYSCGTKKTVDIWLGDAPSILLCGCAPLPHVVTWSRFKLLLSLLKPE